MSFINQHLVSHIPAWFPGAGFKRHALYCRKLTNEMVDRPFEFVKKNMVLVLCVVIATPFDSIFRQLGSEHHASRLN